MKHTMTIVFMLFVFNACSGSRPTNLGIMSGHLAPCPGKPNCVVSQDGDEKHTIAPIAYRVDRIVAFQVLKDILSDMERTDIIEETSDYIRMECKTRVFRFVDDVEFYFPDEPVIQVRSASRLGYSDLGVNRKRIEKIRALFEEQVKNVEITQEKGE